MSERDTEITTADVSSEMKSFCDGNEISSSVARANAFHRITVSNVMQIAV